MSVCLRCGKQLGANDKFCGSCGYQTRRQQTTSNNQAGNNGPSQTSSFVCLRCGKALKTTAKFCGSCGYPVQNSTQTQQTTTNNQTSYAASYQITTKEELIAEIDRMLVYFSRVQDLYDEYDRCAEIRNAELDRKEREMRRSRHSDSLLDDPNGFEHFLLSLSITSLIAIPFILNLITKPYSILISIGCFLLSSSIGFLLVWSGIKGKQEEKRCKEHMNSIRAELAEYHRNYGNCIVTVYNANPRILRKVRDYLTSGKANTLKEALILACN